MKLTKRNNEAVLAVTMIDQNKSNTIHLDLDIPVTVIAPSVGMEFLPPALVEPEFEMDFCLDQFKHVFKLCRHSNFLQISSSSEGLLISLESTQISFQVCCNNSIQNAQNFSIIVDCKTFLKFTNCLLTSPSSIKACKYFFLKCRFL